MGKLSLFNSSIGDWWAEEDRQWDAYIKHKKTFVGPPTPWSMEGTSMDIIRTYTDEEIKSGKHITFDLPPIYKDKK